MHYQLFLPEWPLNPDAERIEAESRKRGITDIWDNSDKLPAHDGPSGKPGLLVAWLNPKNTQHVYDPSKQTWIPSIQKLDSGEHAYWIGIWNGKEPVEKELRRHYTREGMLTELGGQKWIIPTPTTVDQRAVYNDDGSMRWEPIRQFSWMCDEAKLIADALSQSSVGGLELEFDNNPVRQIEWIIRLLRVNYRMLPELAAHLELWTRRQHILSTYLATLNLRVVSKVASNGDQN